MEWYESIFDKRIVKYNLKYHQLLINFKGILAVTLNPSLNTIIRFT